MKKYIFKPYDPSYPELFRKEAERILSNVKGILTIEHVGSTAIPLLGGKGIIDLAVGAPTASLEKISQELQKLGYEFRPQWSTPVRLYFILDLEMDRYHLHLMPARSQEMKEMIAFRDYLLAHPEERELYAQIKQGAAQEAGGVGETYRARKLPFIEKILKEIRES